MFKVHLAERGGSSSCRVEFFFVQAENIDLEKRTRILDGKEKSIT